MIPDQTFEILKILKYIGFTFFLFQNYSLYYQNSSWPQQQQQQQTGYMTYHYYSSTQHAWNYQQPH